MKEIQKLLDIMVALRDPVSGCPWDKKQDFHSISAYTIEEAYEVADAIERNDLYDLKDELGDLLFQVAFHSRLAEEQGAFEFRDVANAINEKMVRRHPHVFGEDTTTDQVELDQQWERHKQVEREGKNLKNESALSGIVSTLPALRWSQKLQKRAAGTGFDWPDIVPVFKKLNEEVEELKAEIQQVDNQSRIMDELGDVLFVCVNLAMHLQIDAEQALRHANNKFLSRFARMEQLMGQDGLSFSELALDQMEQYWQKAKCDLAEENTGL